MEFSTLSRRGFLANAGLAALGLHGRNLFALAAASPVTVRTLAGTLRGEQSAGVSVFRGVPFAEAPVGPLRFRAPVKMKRWKGEREATRFAAAAMQPDAPGVERSEDCLYLNLWAPQGKGPFPVYVWIHGGGFTGGRSFEPLFDGTALAAAGIVCITVAYRLGVFGFLDLEPLLGPGYAGSANNALRDLIAALEWVRENVEAFGGDPSRVTIGGESAGAKLSDILLGVPAARPLFHQVVSESGGAERVWTRADSAVVAHGFGEEWQSGAGSGTARLATAPADDLIAAQQRFIKQWPQHFPLRVEIDGSLVPQLPVETIAAGSSLGKRLLIGTNRDESAAFLGPHPGHDPGAADLGNLPLGRFSGVLGKYRKIYPQMSDEQLRIRAVTAEEYWVPSIRVADAHLKGGGKAWMYQLDFAESSGRLRGYAFHSLDTKLVWDRPSAQVENAAAEAELARQMSHAWVAFVRGEVPAGSGLPPWPEYRSDRRPTMVFNTQNQIELAPQEAELRLWDGVL
jgi:para-nitrobenzyl esterase